MALNPLEFCCSSKSLTKTRPSTNETTPLLKIGHITVHGTLWLKKQLSTSKNVSTFVCVRVSNNKEEVVV